DKDATSARRPTTPITTESPRRASSRSPRNHLAAGQIIQRLPAANELRLSLLNQNLRRQRLTVVVAGHDGAVRPSPLDNQIIANRHDGQASLADKATFFLREDVARFA